MSKDSKPVMGQAGSLGFTFVAAVLIFTAVGYFLDRWLHATPWLMVGGVFVGAAVGFVYMVAVLFSDSPHKRDRADHDDSGAGSDGRPGS
jgi:F0F1-type ATP synthase assembly protein I